MKKRYLCVVGVCGLLVLGCFGTLSYSYMTDSNKVVNTATTAKMDTTLSEPTYSTLPDSNGDGVKDVGTNIVNNKVVTKDPKVTNNSTIGVYSFLRVDIPIRNVMTVATAPSTRVDTELFSYTVNSGWTLMSTTTANGYVSRVYGYNSVLGVGQSTNTLFDRVTYANIVEGELSGQSFQIPITEYSIQAPGFSNMQDAYNSLNW